MTSEQKNALHTKLTQASTALTHGAPTAARLLLQEACTLLCALPTTPTAQQLTPHQLADFEKTGRLPTPE